MSNDAFDRAAAGEELGTCQERAGFLFSHACSYRAVERCTACGKAVCEAHIHEHEDGSRLCTSCSKRAQKQESTRQRDGSRRYRNHHDDHYFYGDYHYRGYGAYTAGYWGYHQYHSYHHHDSHDLTEADGAAFSEGMDGDFDDNYDGS